MRKKESRQDARATAPEAPAGPTTEAPMQAAPIEPVRPPAPQSLPPAPELPRIEASEPPMERSFADAAKVAAPAARSGSNRFPLLAASVALAAAFGAIIGSIGHAAIAKYTAAPVVAAPADTFKVAAKEQVQLKELISRLRGDVAALKTEIEGSTKVANTQFAKLGERVDRAEKAQSEPASRLAKMAETLDRIDRRAAVSTAAAAPATPPAAPVQVASAAPETTGSIPQEAKLAAPKPSTVEGWVLREVVDGFALIEGFNGRLFEVGPGSNIPGVGRVEAIRRQEGQWVVFTPKGIITR